MNVLWEGIIRLLFIGYVLLVAAIVIVPVGLALAVFLILDIVVGAVTWATPGVRPRNIIREKPKGAPKYVWTWVAWIYKNLQRAFFGHRWNFNWTPPILP